MFWGFFFHGLQTIFGPTLHSAKSSKKKEFEFRNFSDFKFLEHCMWRRWKSFCCSGWCSPYCYFPHAYFFRFIYQLWGYSHTHITNYMACYIYGRDLQWECTITKENQNLLLFSGSIYLYREEVPPYLYM